MRKKYLGLSFVIVILCILLCAYFYMHRARLLSDVLAEELEATGNIKVIWITEYDGSGEKINSLDREECDSDLETLETDLNQMKVRYKKKEVGIANGKGFYNLVVKLKSDKTESDVTSFSVGNDGTLHMDNTDKTYTIADEKELLQRIEETVNQ